MLAAVPGVPGEALARLPRALRALLAAALLPAAAAAQHGVDPDTAFHLTTTDLARTPSPFIGNGRLGVVVPALGIGAARSLVAGLYEEAPGDVPRIVALPAWSAVAVHDGARWLGPDTLVARSRIRDYRQVLDLRTGIVRTEYEWADGERRTGIAVESFVSRAVPRLAVLRLELTPRRAGTVRVRFGLRGLPPPKRLPLARLETAPPDWKPADIWYPGHAIVRSRRADREPSGGMVILTSTPPGRGTSVAQAAAVSWPGDLPRAASWARAAGDSAALEIAFRSEADRTYTFWQAVSVATSADDPDPAARARREAAAAREAGYERLAADNAAAWARRWETDIVIEGDAELQKVVRSMLFYLLASADSGTALGIPPMGLSSGGYYGHIFWDSDTWMFPPLLVTHPDVARSLVAFRRRTMVAAGKNATANGYLGTMYPWEADERGVETTPRFAIQNARSEIHVNGDVALAQWQYYLATGDSLWLAQEGYPVIRGTADFWVSRASRDSATGRYHIHDVVSVSEGLIGVSDDAYTNAVARKNLEIAGLASRRIGARPDPRWADMAERIHLPYDSASGFYRTYEGAPDSTLGDVTPLLAYPLGVPMSERAKRSHLEQAVGRLLQGEAGAMMGSTLLSVGAAELGDRPVVDTLLRRSYRPHLRGPFLMLSETPRNDAVNFVTGAGGFLQQVIFGWTGLRFAEAGLEEAFDPVLPSTVERLTLRNFTMRGRRTSVIVDRTGRRIE